MRSLLTLALTLTALSSAAAATNLSYLGPRGTYSDEAATRVAAPQGWTTSTATSITEVAAAVTARKTDYGLLPIENSSGGYVAETLGLLKFGQTPGWRVVGEVTLPINNVLMAKPGTRLSDVKTLYSHPQPFLQSAGYLGKNLPGVTRVEAKSTAAAAEEVSKQAGNDTAAIAAPAAAKVYGLVPLADAIQDDRRNATRFWVVQPGDLTGDTEQVNRAVVLHDAPQGGTSLTLLLSRMERLSFHPVSVVSMPTGELGMTRYLLTFADQGTAQLSMVKEALTRTTGPTTLLGAYLLPSDRPGRTR